MNIISNMCLFLYNTYLVLGHNKAILTRATISLWRKNLSVPSQVMKGHLTGASGGTYDMHSCAVAEAPCKQPFGSHLKGQHIPIMETSL